MSYRRFNLANLAPSLATFATTATPRDPAPRCVATVAAVADLSPRNQIILSAYERMFAACLYGGSEKHLRVVERFLDDHFAEARQVGWCDLALFGCYPDQAFAPVRYDAMGAVTVAALMAQPVYQVSELTMRLANKLAARRPSSQNLAQPVWDVFPFAAP